jgi:hypothetical protein
MAKTSLTEAGYSGRKPASQRPATVGASRPHKGRLQRDGDGQSERGVLMTHGSPGSRASALIGIPYLATAI